MKPKTQALKRRSNAYEKYFGDSGKKLLDKVLTKRRTKLAKAIANTLFEGFPKRSYQPMVRRIEQLLEKWKV